MPSTLLMQKINADCLSGIFKELKSVYEVEKVSPARKKYIVQQVEKYGYLPYPHIKALEELTPAETIIGLEAKLELNNTYNNDKFVFNEDEISPVKRAGFTDSSWAQTEQHNIKLINLAGLGDGNKSEAPGEFIDWLKQLLILPSGNLEKKVLSTTAYLIPFHPRDFGCAYLPTSSGVSPNLEDKLIKEKLDLGAKEQVKLFIALAQLAGHPVMFDVLPQTGRFSKTILANPYAARWFDVKELIKKLNEDLEQIAEDMKPEFHWGDVDYVKGIISESLSGKYIEIKEDHHRHIAHRIECDLDSKRKYHSYEMTNKENQEVIHNRVQKIVNKYAGKSEDIQITEDDITNQGMIIGALIGKGLWPAPGGAWCSSGVPVFNKMSEGAGHPLFKHYDLYENDVSHFANLDCQTPYYFVYFENNEFNQRVVDFYVDFLKNLRAEYNFDAYRVDHVDHVVDSYSQSDDGNPISYRAPRYVLGKVNEELKKEVPYFATLAEYMLWFKYYKEYHQQMHFDLLWGNDISSQFMKNAAQIISENRELEDYNSALDSGIPKMSILKAYNNQDGEFEAINQYPGQLGEDGALFKWFKFKFLPNGVLAERPVMYIDGDESFTKTGIESVIGAEISMKRESNYEFFRKFDAISRFAVNSDLARYGKAEIHYRNDDKSGFVSWIISNDSDESLYIIANENPPTEVIRRGRDDGSVETVYKAHKAIYNKETYIPDGYEALTEFILPDGSLDFVEKDITNLQDNKFVFEKVEPSEFHIYKLKKIK